MAGGAVLWWAARWRASVRAAASVAAAAVGGTDGVEVRGDAELREVDGADADPLGLLYAEGDGERVHPQRAVTLDRLEVVDDGDAQARERVEHGEHHLLPRDRARVEHRVTAPGEGAGPGSGVGDQGFRAGVGVWKPGVGLYVTL